MSEIVIIVALLAVFGFFRGSRRGTSDVAAWTRTVRDLQRQLELTQAELDQQRRQVEELAERLDFAERRLVQMNNGRQLPPPSS